MSVPSRELSEKWDLGHDPEHKLLNWEESPGSSGRGQE